MDIEAVTHLLLLPGGLALMIVVPGHRFSKSDLLICRAVVAAVGAELTELLLLITPATPVTSTAVPVAIDSAISAAVMITGELGE